MTGQDDQDDLAFWRDALAGKWPKIPDQPQCGLYRMRSEGKWISIQIYYSPEPDEHGEFVLRMRVVRLDHDISDLIPSAGYWAACATHPISRAMYDNWRKTGEWLDHISWIGADEPFEGRDTIEDEITAAMTWYNSDGKGISSQLQADMAANWAATFQGREKQAINAFDHELKPIKADEAAIRTKWKPLIECCAKMKRTIKDDWLGPWLKAHPGSMAGSSIYANRISLRTREVLQIVDIHQFCRWIAETNETLDYPKYFVEAMTKFARENSEEFGPLPGTEIVEEESVV